MAFGTQIRRKGFADGGTVDVTVTPTPTSFTGANSSIPAQTADQIAKYPTLPPATQLAQPTLSPQPFSAAMANVPVGGTSGTPTSPYLGNIGANGVPTGSPPPPNPNAALSSLAAPVPPSVTPTSTVASTPSPVTAQPLTSTLGGSQFVGNQMVGNGTVINGQIVNRGGVIKPRHLAGGGIPTSEAMDPWYTRAEERGALQPQGLVKSTGAGRTDVHSINVPSGSYVLPADVVSGLGEGNTLAGSSVIDRMMGTLPFGIQAKKIGHGPGAPRAPAGPPLSEEHPYGETEGLPAGEGRARGGGAKAKPQPSSVVPIIVAGGEHILYPQTIIQKFGSLQKGHAVLDKFVLGARKKTIGDMKKLKPPKR